MSDEIQRLIRRSVVTGVKRTQLNESDSAFDRFTKFSDDKFTSARDSVNKGLTKASRAASDAYEDARKTVNHKIGDHMLKSDDPVKRMMGHAHNIRTSARHGMATATTAVANTYDDVMGSVSRGAGRLQAAAGQGYDDAMAAVGNARDAASAGINAAGEYASATLTSLKGKSASVVNKATAEIKKQLDDLGVGSAAEVKQLVSQVFDPKSYSWHEDAIGQDALYHIPTILTRVGIGLVVSIGAIGVYLGVMFVKGEHDFRKFVSEHSPNLLRNTKALSDIIRKQGANVNTSMTQRHIASIRKDITALEAPLGLIENPKQRTKFTKSLKDLELNMTKLQARVAQMDSARRKAK